MLCLRNGLYTIFMYDAINLLNFFLLFNGLRKIKIRLDALQRNRNYLHVRIALRKN